MYSNKIPSELVKHICNYLFGVCDHCFDKIYFENLQKNVLINKYRHIFDDDYFLPKESIYFNIICNKCLKNYFINDNKFIYALLNHKTCEKNKNCFCRLHST